MIHRGERTVTRRAGGRRAETRWVVVLIAVTATVLAGCGSNDDDTTDSTGSSATRSSTPMASTTSTSPRTTTSAPPGAPVPGACTSSGCPDLDGSSGNLMRGQVTPENADAVRVTRFLDEAITDLDELWGRWFAELQWGDATPGRVLIQPGTAFTSRCVDDDGNPHVVPSDEPNAYFCTRDSAPNGAGVTRIGSVVLPVQTFVNFWHGEIVGRPAQLGSGEFAAAMVAAHEYGHNVMFRIVQRGNLSESRETHGDNTELLADCFAGNWAATALRAHLLRPDDLRQAVSLIEAIGDPMPGQGHGTSTQRGLAIQRGFGLPGRPGQPIECLTQYWPEVFGS